MHGDDHYDVDDDDDDDDVLPLSLIVRVTPLVHYGSQKTSIL